MPMMFFILLIGGLCIYLILIKGYAEHMNENNIGIFGTLGIKTTYLCPFVILLISSDVIPELSIMK